MARTTRSSGTTVAGRPSLMSRLRGRQNKKVEIKHSHNPITGTNTTTKKTTTHPQGIGRHGDSGQGLMASTNSTGRRSRRHGEGPLASTKTTGRHHREQRRPSMGDKISGGLMRLRESLTGRPGVKASGTRRTSDIGGRGDRY